VKEMVLKERGWGWQTMGLQDRGWGWRVMGWGSLQPD
jgi:hypothetical protein